MHIITVYVTGFRKTCIFHTSDFKYLEWYTEFRAVRGIVVLQSLKVSHPSKMPNRFYESIKLKNWMYELCMFLQIRSHISVVWNPISLDILELLNIGGLLELCQGLGTIYIMTG